MRDGRERLELLVTVTCRGNPAGGNPAGGNPALAATDSGSGRDKLVA